MKVTPFVSVFPLLSFRQSERFIATIALVGVLHVQASAAAITAPAAPFEYSAPMIEMRDSNERGAVLLRDAFQATLIVVKVDKPQEGQPVEIASGSCASARLKYHLEPLTMGQTVTTLPRESVASLRNANYLVVIRRSSTDHRVVSCGTLSAQN